ncbi:MAG TPA: FecR family protein, partial [Gemmatimonadaceae bacterium]|nr:FecR family protein [Gemmatimonadaceae bacterium]
ITDQQVLERLFRASYLKWVADAKGRLKEASSSAPRVVSKAFHLAWQDRKRFHSQDELDAFLGANIQHGAAREISRIAGVHRMSHGGAAQKHESGEMSVDEAWQRLKSALEGAAPESQRQRASTARHEAAGHMAQLAQKRNWKPFILVGIVALAAAGAGLYWIDKAGASRAVDHALNAADVRSYETSYGQQMNVGLDDGTQVRLGPQTKLTIPKRFGMTGGFRAVKIAGTANFSVTRASTDQPFEVRTGNAIIVARGTDFVVRAFAEDSNIIVHVKEGSVDVRVGEQIKNVATGTALQVKASGETSVPSAEDLDEARTWADGNVTIVGHDLRYVLPALKRWYGLDIRVQDTTLMTRKVFVRAAMNSPKEAISSVEQSGGLKFTYIGENMAFQDTVPSKATKAAKAPARRR